MPYATDATAATIPLIPVTAEQLHDVLNALPKSQRNWAETQGFAARSGQHCCLPDDQGQLVGVLYTPPAQNDLLQVAALASALPAGTYRLPEGLTAQQEQLAALGWGLESYRFDRYRQRRKPLATLLLDADWADEVRALCEAQWLVRDLVNTPTEDMGPETLAQALISAGDAHGAETECLRGEALLTENYPAIHAVGRAASTPPLLAKLRWGKSEHPLLVLVGKGVVFDSGGLNIKPGGSMALMKKDMGGAAHVVALAQLIMQARLPVQLLVLMPCVENAIAGNAYRPGDVIHTRLGKTIEIGNTDAEGRMILCDALAEAMELEPDLVLDYATLTGAARVAMGPDIPPIFANDKALARGLMDAGEAVADLLWELPLHAPYLDMMKSDIADLNNAGKGGFAGAITAALFLQEFVKPDIPWCHFDTFAWSPKAQPARPLGGEALGLRASFRYLQQRYGSG